MKNTHLSVFLLAVSSLLPLLSCTSSYEPPSSPPARSLPCQSNATVQTSLGASLASLSLLGFQVSHEITYGSLREGETRIYSIVLDEGQYYMLTALGDEDCNAIDITVRDNAGNVVDRGTRYTEPSQVSIANTKPATTQRYEVVVRMSGCRREPCCYAVVVGHTAIAGSPSGSAQTKRRSVGTACTAGSLNSVEKQIRGLESLAGDIGSTVFLTITGSLAQGESQDIPLQELQGQTGRFAVTSATDNNSWNFGFSVLTDKGEDVTEDRQNLGSGYYSVGFSAREENRYSTRVTMRDCRAPRCCFGLVVSKVSP